MTVKIHSTNQEKRVLIVQSSIDNGKFVEENWGWVRYSPKAKHDEFKAGDSIDIPEKYVNEFPR